MRFPHRLIGAFIVGMAIVLVSCAQATQSEPVELLKSYLRVDTSNPPGNEEAGAKFLGAILEKEGIKPQYFQSAPNRACVYARLKGTGKKRAVILLSHIDVVPAQAKDWKYPPFSGEVHDDEIWGRGALDMKGTGIIHLVTLLRLKRSGLNLDRDVIFLATPDEEVGGGYGADFFIKNHKDLIKDAEFLTTEGFNIACDDNGKQQFWAIDTAEKSLLWLKLTARGKAGHASMPDIDSAPNHLILALGRLIAAPPAMWLTPATQTFFQGIAPLVSEPLRSRFANITKSIKDPHFRREMQDDKVRLSMLSDTITVTVLQGGYKTNVIPQECAAEIDCRLLPGCTKENTIDYIRKTINDPTIEISTLAWQLSSASPIKSEMMDAIKAEADLESGGTIPVVPAVPPWFTDSHFFRDLGIICYGFEPFPLDRVHQECVHGVNERIPVKLFEAAVDRMYNIIKRLTVSDNQMLTK